MAAAAKPEEQPTAGTAVARRVDARVAELKERNQLVAAIRGTQWGRDTSPEVARAVAHYCHENNLDPVRHVEILGGRIYLTSALYDEKGAPLLRAGVIVPDEPEYINADPRLDEQAKAGAEWAVQESERRLKLRIQYNVPEKAAAAVVQRFRIASSGAVIVGVNWCGGGSKQRDPVGDTEPAKTAQTRARRRAWTQIADVIPGYAEVIRPLEIAAKVASEQMPVSVVDAPRGPRPLITDGSHPYDAGTAVNSAPIPPGQFADEDHPSEAELALDDPRTAPARSNALRDS
jgi:hypothetical protein